MKRSNPVKKRKKKHSSKKINLQLIHHRFNLRTSIVWIIAIIVISGSILILKSNIITIKSVNCRYFNESNCPDIINAELNRLIGTNILNFSSDSLNHKLLAIEPQARNVDIDITFPHTIDIQLNQEEILANVKIATNSASLLVSRSYTVIGQSNTQNSRVPTIINPSANNLRMGDHISENPLRFSLELIEKLSKSYINTSEIIVYSDRLILVELPKQRQAIFTTHNDLSRQVTSLQLILSKATITQEVPVIDVRYNQPVLRPFR